MKKRILSILCLIILCLGVLRPFCVCGETPLDVSEEANLTLYYQKDGKTFPNLRVGIFRVAEALPDGDFQLIAPFSSYPVNITGITSQEQWQKVAATFTSYITANAVAPLKETQTDAEGIARFTDLSTGLYLVREVVAETDAATYLFNQFMVYLPTPQSDGTYNYAVEAKPKSTGFTPKTQYSVTVLWQDEGFEKVRPKEVSVDIFNDSALYDTQLLSADGNWFYTWYLSGEDNGKWSVAQRSISSAYKVTVQRNGNHFTIINTRQADPPGPPQTGDTFALLPIVLGMCLSGIALLILALYFRRRK